MVLAGQHLSEVTVQCYPRSVVIDFAMLPTQRFWQETVSLLDVVCPQSNQWECMLLGRNFQLHNKISLYFILLLNDISSCLQSFTAIFLKPKKLWQKVLNSSMHLHVINNWATLSIYLQHLTFLYLIVQVSLVLNGTVVNRWMLQQPVW